MFGLYGFPPMYDCHFPPVSYYGSYGYPADTHAPIEVLDQLTFPNVLGNMPVKISSKLESLTFWGPFENSVQWLAAIQESPQRMTSLGNAGVISILTPGDRTRGMVLEKSLLTSSVAQTMEEMFSWLAQTKDQTISFTQIEDLQEKLRSKRVLVTNYFDESPEKSITHAIGRAISRLLLPPLPPKARAVAVHVFNATHSDRASCL